MKQTRISLILAAATLGLFAGTAQAGAIIFDFGGSVALSCSASDGSCAVAPANGGLLNLKSVNSSYGFDAGSLVKLLNYAINDSYRIAYAGGNTYIDLGRGFDTSLILSAIKADSGLVDSLYWRPTYLPPGSFELRPIKPPHSIPEPGTVAMFGVALLGLYMMWRRQRALEAR